MPDNLRLNLGCGKLPLEGYKNVDISLEARCDERYDLTEGIKEGDDSVGEINCGCMMEQIGDNDKFIKFLNECHRVLIPGGLMQGYVPSTDPRVMFLDPMDKRFFQEDSFKYFWKGQHHHTEFGSVYGFKGWSRVETNINDSGILFFKMYK